MNKHLITVFTSLMTTSLMLSQLTASAYSYEQPEYDNIQAMLNSYTQNMKDDYYKTTTPRSKSSIPLTATLHHQEGLSADDIRISASIKSVNKTDLGYEVKTDITTHASLRADSGTQIYVAGHQTDSLDSIWTDEHLITVSEADTSGNYTILSDQITEKDDDIAQITPADPLLTSYEKVPASLDIEGALDSKAAQMAQADFGTNSAGVNYIKAINYADKWTSDPYQDKMNSAYPSFNQNCTNFISQAFHQGGLTLTRLWNYSTNIPSLTTIGWMNADSNYSYMKHYTHSFTSLDNVWKAWEGSILYVDWTSDNEIDHAMIVVGVVVKDGKANPVIDQKTKNRHQITLTESLQNAHNDGKDNMTWYGLQYKYD